MATTRLITMHINKGKQLLSLLPTGQTMQSIQIRHRTANMSVPMNARRRLLIRNFCLQSRNTTALPAENRSMAGTLSPIRFGKRFFPARSPRSRPTKSDMNWRCALPAASINLLWRRTSIRPMFIITSFSIQPLCTVRTSSTTIKTAPRSYGK